LAVPYDEAIDPDDVRTALRANPGVKFLSAVHSETPSGTVNPIREIGAIAREFGVLTLADTVSGIGGELVSPEEWGIDIAIAGPQKCLSGAPGLALLAISPAAWEAMERADPPLTASYLSILDWKRAWIEGGKFPFTPSVTDIFGLEATLEQALEEGMEAMAAATRRSRPPAGPGSGRSAWSCGRPRRDRRVLRDGRQDAGRLTDEQIRGTMRDRWGVMISPGYGALHGKLIRLGHMGHRRPPDDAGRPAGGLRADPEGPRPPRPARRRRRGGDGRARLAVAPPSNVRS
jgi:pyridoxamine--pyruvate transaminase